MQGQPATKGKLTSAKRSQKGFKTLQNAFDTRRFRTHDFQIIGGDLSHYANMAVKTLTIFVVYDSQTYIYAHTCIYMHIHANTYI